MKIANGKILFASISIPEFVLQVSKVELRSKWRPSSQVHILLPDESLELKLSLRA